MCHTCASTEQPIDYESKLRSVSMSATVVTSVMREIMVVHNNALPAMVANMRMTTDDDAADADWTRDDLCVEIDVL